MMINDIINDPTAAVLGAGATVTGLIYFARWARRVYFTEKTMTSLDLASQSLFENLRLENQRMSQQMSDMASKLNDLAKENINLHTKISELNTSINRLLNLELVNKHLQEDILKKDIQILELTSKFAEFNDTIKLRQAHRE